MKLNYIMLPENSQPRPRPGCRVQKVSQTFPPFSRAGRRVQGEAKATATVAGNAKKEEDRAKEFTKFVKTLNKKVAAQGRTASPAGEVVEGDSAPRLTRTSERLQRLTTWLARSTDAARSGSRLSSKREAAKSATEPIWCRAVKRVKVKIAMSSMVKPEEIPRPHNPVNQIQVIANVVDANDTNQHQTLVGPTDPRLVNGGMLYHQFPGVDAIQNQLPFNQQPVHGVITPGLSHSVLAHQNVRFSGSEIHNHACLESERTAVACAYIGMDQDEPMDLSPDFPSRVADDDYRNLERTAIACAYAAMDEPMDTALDDTQGPMAYAVHQNVPPVIGFVGNPQQPQFDHTVMFQQPIYETLRPPGHQHLIDHLWPPAYPHADNQIPPQSHQERFINENLPLRHHYQPGHYPQGEEYLGLLPEHGHNAPVHPVVQQLFYEQDIHRMAQAEMHRQPIGHAVHFYPGVQEERFDPGLVQQHLNELVFEHDLGGNWNAGGGWRHAGAEGQHDDRGFFVDVFGGHVVEQEEPNRHTGEAHILDRIEVLFGDNSEEDEEDGNSDDNDDDNDDNEEENDDDNDDNEEENDDDNDDNEEENELQIII